MTTGINRASSLHKHSIKHKLDQLIITNDAKNIAIEELTTIYKTSAQNSPLSTMAYQTIKQLITGIFRKDLIKDLFLNISKVQFVLAQVKKYQQQITDVLCQDQLDNQYFQTYSLNDYEKLQNRDNFEQQPNFYNIVRNLQDEINFSQQQIYTKSILSSEESIQPLNMKVLNIIHPITLTIFPSPAVNICQGINNSDLQTHCSYSMFSKSCMIDTKFVQKAQNDKVSCKTDYKKQYQKKLQNVLIKNAMTHYKKRK